MLVDSTQGNPDIKATGNGAQQHVGKSHRHPLSKVLLSIGDLDLPCNTYFLPWAHLSPHHIPNGISISRAIFAGIWSLQTNRQTHTKRPTNRQIDRLRYSVYSNNTPHLWSVQSSTVVALLSHVHLLECAMHAMKTTHRQSLWTWNDTVKRLATAKGPKDTRCGEKSAVKCVANLWSYISNKYCQDMSKIIKL